MTHKDGDRPRTRLKQDSGPEILALTGRMARKNLHPSLSAVGSGKGKKKNVSCVKLKFPGVECELSLSLRLWESPSPQINVKIVLTLGKPMGNQLKQTHNCSWCVLREQRPPRREQPHKDANHNLQVLGGDGPPHTEAACDQQGNQP